MHQSHHWHHGHDDDDDGADDDGDDDDGDGDHLKRLAGCDHPLLPFNLSLTDQLIIIVTMVLIIPWWFRWWFRW